MAREGRIAQSPRGGANPGCAMVPGRATLGARGVARSPGIARRAMVLENGAVAVRRRGAALKRAGLGM